MGYEPNIRWKTTRDYVQYSAQEILPEIFGGDSSNTKKKKNIST